MEVTRDNNGNFTLRCNTAETVAIAHFFGHVSISSAVKLGLPGDSSDQYNTLADALEFGEGAPFNVDQFGRSSLYNHLCSLPRLELKSNQEGI